MFLHLILCISTHFDNKLASVAKTASCFSVWWITLLHTTECMQYFSVYYCSKSQIHSLVLLSQLKKMQIGHCHFGAHASALKVSRALSKSSGPGILGLGLAGEKLPRFLPGWEVSEKSHKSETGDHCFNPESNTEYSLPPQESILFTSLWRYLVSNLFPA